VETVAVGENLSDDEVLALLREAVASQEPPQPIKHIGEIEWQTPLTALGIDSIGLLEMAGCIEGKLNIEFSLDQLARVECVGDLAAVIRVTLASSPPTSGGREGSS
jgi:acyl carrier protein